MENIKPPECGSWALYWPSPGPSPTLTRCSFWLTLPTGGVRTQGPWPVARRSMVSGHQYFISPASHFRHISGRESICEGGNVIFNTSHPSYFKSLLVDELWICNDVRRFNGIPLPCWRTLFTEISRTFCHDSKFYGRPIEFSRYDWIFLSNRINIKNINI